MARYPVFSLQAPRAQMHLRFIPPPPAFDNALRLVMHG
jgi:hypothetical protein